MAAGEEIDLGNGFESEEIKVSMFLKAMVIQKIKAIAELEKTLPKEEINDALLEKIRSYENKNGIIKLPEEEDL